jgi:hypothetical protein
MDSIATNQLGSSIYFYMHLFSLYLFRLFLYCFDPHFFRFYYFFIFIIIVLQINTILVLI